MLKKILVNLSIFLISLLLLGVCGEALVRSLQAAGHMKPVSARSLSKLNVLQKSNGSQYNAAIVQSQDPLLAWELDRNDPNVNAQGYRGNLVPINKPPNTVRIAILGDSYTYGFSVPSNQSFVYLLEQKLNALPGKTHYEVLNFGVIGYGTTQELEYYQTKVQQYHPDVLILAYVLNDIARPSDSTTFMKSLGDARNNLRSISKYSQFAAWGYIQWINAKLNVLGVALHYMLYKLDNTRWTETQLAIADLKRLSMNQNTVMLGVIFPFFIPDFGYYPFASVHAQIGNVFATNGIPFRDILDAFDINALEKYQVSPSDGHPNPAGHEIAASAILELLIEQNIVKVEIEKKSGD